MNKFKVKKIGLDLRNPKGSISALGLSGNFGESEIDYILLDLLCSKDYYIDTVCTLLETKENPVEVYLEIDLSKFNSSDPWEEASKVWRCWMKSEHWKRYSKNYSFIFKNLPNEDSLTIPESVESLWGAKRVGLGVTDIKEYQEQINSWKKYFGKLPKVIARPISPLYYNPEMEKYITDLVQPEEVIGLEYEGGWWNKDRELEIFGKSYLLSFAGVWSDTIFIPVYTDLLKEGASQVIFLSGLRNREMEEKERAKFVIKKLVSKLKEAPRKLVYESCKLELEGKTWIIPSDNTTMLYPYSDTVYSFSKPIRESYPLSTEPTEFELGAKNRIDTVFGENASTLNPDVAWRLLTLTVVDWIKEKYTEEDRWDIDFVEIGDHALGINLVQTAKRKWWNKYSPEIITETRDFILTMTNPTKISFIDLDAIPESV